jgi:hypothetical protein
MHIFVDAETAPVAHLEEYLRFTGGIWWKIPLLLAQTVRTLSAEEQRLDPPAREAIRKCREECYTNAIREFVRVCKEIMAEYPEAVP